MSIELNDEWKALRTACGVFPLRHRRLLNVAGEDRGSFLQGMLTNDVRKLKPGEGMVAAHLDRNGKIIAALRVYADQSELVLDIADDRATALRESLERFVVADDVEITEGEQQPLLAVEGPQAAAIVQLALRVSVPAAAYSHASTDFDGKSLRVVCASEIGGAGVLICAAASSADRIREVLCEAGARPVHDAVVEVARTEAGVPRFGIDMTEDNLVMEVGLGDAISFNKGCYLGQEVVERVAARGHVNRRLCGLLVDGDALPPAGTVLTAGGKEVGFVTSAARSPNLDRVVALASVHRSTWEPGTVVDAGGTRAVVTALPFVPPVEPAAP